VQQLEKLSLPNGLGVVLDRSDTGSIPTLASSPFAGILEEKASSFSEIFSGWTTPPLFGLNHFNSPRTR
jgi:hypothetical protein